MLIQQPRFAAVRTATDALLQALDAENEDALRTVFTALRVGRQLDQALMVWANLAAAGFGTAKALFTVAPVDSAPWRESGERLLDAACRGDLEDLEKAAGLCAELETAQAWELSVHVLRLAHSCATMARGLDTWIGIDALQRVCAENLGDAAWMDAAAWIVARLGTGQRHEAQMRFARLAVEENKLNEARRLWLAVAKHVVASDKLRSAEAREDGDVPGVPAYQQTRQAVLIMQADGPQALEQAEALLSEGGERSALWVWDIAIAISHSLVLPAQEPEASPTRSIRDELISATPPPMLERMGRMTAWAHQLVLSFIDADPAALAQTMLLIADFDDAPGREPYPLPRFDFVVKRVVELVNLYFAVHDEAGGVSDADTAAGAKVLVEQYAPPEHRQAALARLAALPGGTGDVDVTEGGAPDEGLLLAMAASAAWLATREDVIPVQQDVRLTLLAVIRDSEAAAMGVPERETVATISDRDARAFLDQLFDSDLGPFPMSENPAEWASGERAVIGILKEHLLTIPATATTPEQAREIKLRIIASLQRTLAPLDATRRRSAQRPDRSGVVRNQPKRKKPKGKR